MAVPKKWLLGGWYTHGLMIYQQTRRLITRKILSAKVLFHYVHRVVYHIEERDRLWNSGVRVIHYGTCNVDREDGGLWMLTLISQPCSKWVRPGTSLYYHTKFKRAVGCPSFTATKCNWKSGRLLPEDLIIINSNKIPSKNTFQSFDSLINHIDEHLAQNYLFQQYLKNRRKTTRSSQHNQFHIKIDEMKLCIPSK